MIFGNGSAQSNISIYRYDGNGSMTSDPNAGINFAIYDCNNMPLAEYKGNTRYDYTYDANGTRISKTIGKNTTYYTHGVSGNAEMETIIGTSSTTSRYYIWGLDHLGHITSAMHYYYLKDHLGSIRMTVNKNGKVVSYNDYYPYGSIMPMRSMNMAMADERYKFIGKEQDAETGYGYFDNRYYCSLTGMFGRPDELSELNPFQSPYVYALNNPVRFLDPSGLDAKDDSNYAQANNSYLVDGVTVTSTKLNNGSNSTNSTGDGCNDNSVVYKRTIDISTRSFEKIEVYSKEEAHKGKGPIVNTYNQQTLKPQSTSFKMGSWTITVNVDGTVTVTNGNKLFAIGHAR